MEGAKIRLTLMPLGRGLNVTVPRLAQVAYRSKDFAGCARLIESMLQMVASGNFDRSISFDLRIAGDDAKLNLGACYAQLGDRKRAVELMQGLVDSPRVGAIARANLKVLAAS